MKLPLRSQAYGEKIARLLAYTDIRDRGYVLKAASIALRVNGQNRTAQVLERAADEYGYEEEE